MIAYQRALASITDITIPPEGVVKPTPHEYVKIARFQMFDIYDEQLKGPCALLSKDSLKHAFIETVTSHLFDYLSRLGKLDLYNGCLSKKIEFPSVVYTWP